MLNRRQFATPRLVLGTLSAQGTSGLVVFSRDPHRRLAFRINDMEIMLLEASVWSANGARLARVVDGYFEAEPGSAAVVVQRPGHFRISHPLCNDVMPDWALRQMRKFEPSFAGDGSVRLLDMEVLSPNLVRVQGVWLDETGGMIITEGGMSFVRPERSFSVVGAGLGTVFMYVGPVDQALFAMES